MVDDIIMKLLILLLNLAISFCYLNFNKCSLISKFKTNFKNKYIDKNSPNVKIKKSNKYILSPGWMEKEAKIFNDIVNENKSKNN